MVKAESFGSGPVFRQMGGCGIHELVIESQEHSRRLSSQPVEHLEESLRRDRW